MANLKKLQDLDRRWVYLFIAIAIITPLLFPFNSKTYSTSPVENLYQLVDSYSPYVRADDLNNDGIISEEEVEAFKPDRAIFMDFYHDASTMPELFPMEIAMLRHCFYRKVPVFTFTAMIAAAPIIEDAIATASAGVEAKFPDRKIVRGRDYCNIGYKPAALYLPILLGMGDDIAAAVETDADGNRMESLPIFTETSIKNYNQMNLVYETSGSEPGTSWMIYARPKFGVNVGVGLTAVMAADQYPYLSTGQCVGMTAGLKGAAEYEMLVDRFAMNNVAFSKGQLNSTNEEVEKMLDITSDTVPSTFKQARLGMNAQSVAHILIILFIVVGNIGYFIERRNKKSNL
jgi:hypothetical protein